MVGSAEDLITRYRPQAFDDVVGHSDVVASLQATLKAKLAHAFLFTGPAGVGKTTLARIVAREVGCEPQSVIEVDAASHTGIDHMRELTHSLRYKSLAGTPQKAVILDEAHRLSTPSWSSLLKAIEEPPEHAYWMLCTTEESKIPQTIRSRCQTYHLKPLPSGLIYDHILDISNVEGFGVSEDIIDLVAQESSGSMRRALSDLGRVTECKTRKEAAQLLRAPSESKDVIDLCRYLTRGGLTWKKSCVYLSALADHDPEQVRIIVVNYLAKALLSADEKQAPWLLTVLQAFSEPYQRSDKVAPLLLSMGRLIFETE